ncbi:DUF6557 family protein [Natranaerobius thermophilus]|uniref:Uncharacterized protein n=1 Tax=Natranaerobius thermophilus (strain ATCC BAA-1301 / DSM 18059 / JW/NM-WN-LF) TaxID=457570 RepID=B2A5E9_NATTJ|nr:DUF6557 family protein [Natranaerobius thermophilus]ACB83987.1 hypothetical protein Nther_0391 [Natranaerobius thermophilus JW/NM-WN-LF]
MLFKDLFKQNVNFVAEIEDKIVELFPHEKENVEKGNYRKLMNQILNLKPLLVNLITDIEKIETDEGIIYDFGVNEYHSPKDKLNIKKEFVLEHVPWEAYLGIEISETDLLEFGSIELIAIFLENMAGLGFDYEDGLSIRMDFLEKANVKHIKGEVIESDVEFGDNYFDGDEFQ